MQHGREIRHGEVAGGQRGGIDRDAHHPARATAERRLGNLGNGFYHVVHLRGETAEREVIERRALQRERQNRHIVDRAGFDDRRRHAGGDTVKIRLQLLVEPHERGLNLRTHPEAHDHQCGRGAGSGIEIFDAGNFPEQFFHRPRDAVFDLPRGGARHPDKNIHHRDLDLRLFFPREHQHGKEPEQHRSNHRDRREFRLRKHSGQPAGQPAPRRLCG